MTDSCSIRAGNEAKMNQLSFLDMDYSLKKRKTRREKFLGKMDALIPWQRSIEQIKPHYHLNLSMIIKVAGQPIPWS